MMSWFFRKRDAADAPAPATLSIGPKAPVQRSADAAAATSKGEAGERVAGRVDDEGRAEWMARLHGAQGDDAALLKLAATAPALDLKLAAVEALGAEAALRQAERDFRSHDRKVHRLAKQRLEEAVARREAQAAAQGLLERAAALQGDADLPINYLVELDQAWEALAADRLLPDQVARFAALRAGLDTLVRERGEAQQRLRRWLADARQALQDWPAAAAAVAEQGGSGDFERLRRPLEALREARPDDRAAVELDDGLAQALQTAQAVAARLAWFEGQPEPVKEPEPAPADEPVPIAADETLALPADRAESAPAAGWSDLPAVPDADLARILAQRHELWQRARQAEQPAAPAAPPSPARRSPGRGPAAAPAAPQWGKIETRVQQAEQALADGQTAAMQKYLQAIDAALQAVDPASLPAALRARHQALHGEASRLRGWKQWGGARARDDLAADAESLARLTLAAGEPGAGHAQRLNLKAHADAIQALRQRWKELDHLGATASQALWQRFDQALQAAFAPVAAQHAALKAARQENLAAREVLLAQLEGLPLPQAEDGSNAGERPAMDWKSLSHELGQFHTAWRKLGPPAHTVPAAARDTLQRRLQQAVERIEGPLQAIRGAAAAEREGLVARAEALLAETGAGRPWPDAARALRDLQAEWQDHARRLPLPRALEAGLWSRFRAATDAVYAQREAAAAARDAAFAANVAACEGLLERLSALEADSSAADIERTLAEVDRAWREVGELPRGAADALEARRRAGRAAASGLLDAAARLRWQAACEALAARLAECEAHEDAGGAGEPVSPWQPTAGLPPAWGQALEQRRARPLRPGQPGAVPETAVNDLLLQLEMALDLPVTPERQAERQMLKLRALKDVMEGRAHHKSASALPARRADALPALLRLGGLEAAQRERLHTLVAALRQAGPDALDAPAVRR